MAANSFFKIFLPKDRIFYSLFENVAETVNKMGMSRTRTKELGFLVRLKTWNIKMMTIPIPSLLN